MSQLALVGLLTSCPLPSIGKSATSHCASRAVAKAKPHTGLRATEYMKHVACALVLLLLAGANAQQTAHKAWLMGGACAAFRLPLAEGDSHYQLLTSLDSNVR